MEYVRLGKTDLLVSRVAFGAMRLSGTEGEDNAADIVRKAYDSGINFFDTSRKRPETEKLLGDALYDIRKNVFLSTASGAENGLLLSEDLETSLMTLHCDSVDLFQYEAEDFLPLPGGRDGIYSSLQEMKRIGKINHIGIVTTHYEIAKQVVESDLYETLQFPFSMLSPDYVNDLVKLCEEHDVGFIAMQPLGGGLVDNIPLAFGFLYEFENVIPIWGVQTLEEMEQILYFNEHPPVIDEKFHEDVEKIRMFFS
ncbi:MAG: aldo/keto reductase [Treponema sp.]|nr:aldo/keto reductase [Treponema sp.]